MNVQPALLDVVTDVSTLLGPSGVSVHQDTNCLAIERLVQVRTNIFGCKIYMAGLPDWEEGLVGLCES